MHSTPVQGYNTELVHYIYTYILCIHYAHYELVNNYNVWRKKVSMCILARTRVLDYCMRIKYCTLVACSINGGCDPFLSPWFMTNWHIVQYLNLMCAYPRHNSITSRSSYVVRLPRLSLCQILFFWFPLWSKIERASLTDAWRFRERETLVPTNFPPSLPQVHCTS